MYAKSNLNYDNIAYGDTSEAIDFFVGIPNYSYSFNFPGGPLYGDSEKAFTFIKE